MSLIVAFTLSTGISCGIWALIASFPALNLITWVGFAGCTTYFASGKHGLEGVSATIFSNLSGVFSAIVAVYISGLFPASPSIAIIMTGIISGTMCLKSVIKPLWFIPGAFIGCFSSFAYLSSGKNILSADLIPFVISLLVGNILALACDKGGMFLFDKFGKKEVETNE